MSKLHDCKRGLDTATPSDYNRWWRERAADRDRIAELEAELTQERKDFHEAWDMYQAAKAKLEAIEANIRSWDEHSTTGLESFVVNSFRAALGEAK